MKNVVRIALAASLVAGATAQSHAHQHRHRHAKKHEHGSPVDKRAPDVSVVYATPVVTVYEINNEVVDATEAEAGIKAGLFTVVGETTPTFVPPPPPSSTATPTPSSSVKAAQFFEVKSSTSSTSTSSTSTSSTSTSSTTPPAPSTTSTQPAPASSSAAPSSSSGSSNSSGGGLTAPFPDGEIPCSNGVPTDYGAVNLDWLNLDGWASVQSTGFWTPGVLFSNIEQPDSGACTVKSFCSYACPPGYEKGQWPTTSQGATGQSIGGLYCNADGYLERTHPTHETLCIQGAPGVYIKNELSQLVSTCKTNYPGDERMSIPFIAEAGGSIQLTNPIQTESYVWQGSYTSAQYYVNNPGIPKEDACLWKSAKYPDSAGNWAPKNIGVNTDPNGKTWVSIMENHPTSNAELDFDIEITGDVASECAYINGAYKGGTSNGCTTQVNPGGTAYYVFKARGS